MLLTLAFAGQSVAATLNASIAAHGGLNSFQAHVDMVATLNGQPKQETYDIGTDGSTALIRIRKPEHGEEAASDRTFYFGLTKMTAYDAAGNERLERELPKARPLVTRVASTLGEPDDMIKDLLDRASMQAFLVSMRKLSGWRYRATANGPTLSRQAVGAHTVMEFTAGQSLLSRLDVSSGKNTIHWRFAYERGGPTALNPPVTARKVTSFTVRLIPAHFLSPKAKQIADELLAAYLRLQNGEIIVDGDDGHVEIYISGRRLRENKPHLSYAYDGSRLTILGGKGNSFYAGQAVRRFVPDYVAEVGGRVEPISMRILRRKIPFAEIFAPRVAVSYAGEMAIGADSVEMLKIDFVGGRVSLFVRKRDHLMDSVLTQSLDAHGRVLATSARRFKYAMLGELQPDYRFIVTRRAGQPKLPLPRLKTGR